MNLADALCAPTDRDHVALAGREPVTYGELDARAGTAAARVASHAAPDDRVAILAGNEMAFVVAYLGTLRAGAVAVPLNVSSPSHELAHELDAIALGITALASGLSRH